MDRSTRGRSTGRPLTVALVALVVTGCGRVSFDSIGGPGPSDADPSGDGDAPTDGAQSLCTGLNLVAHWRMDETTGATIVDDAGNNDGVWTDSNDGTVATEAMTGQRAGALLFDTGSSVYVPGFVVPSQGTFTAWLTSNFDDSAAPGGSHPMVFDAAAPRSTLSYAADIGAYGLRTNDVSWQTTLTSPADLTGWFHLAATWSASGSQLYLNGVAVGAPGVTDARSTSPAGLYLGTRELGQRWWGGLIDDVRIYDYPLNATKVAAVYACP